MEIQVQWVKSLEINPADIFSEIKGAQPKCRIFEDERSWKLIFDAPVFGPGDQMEYFPPENRPDYQKEAQTFRSSLQLSQEVYELIKVRARTPQTTLGDSIQFAATWVLNPPVTIAFVDDGDNASLGALNYLLERLDWERQCAKSWRDSSERLFAGVKKAARDLKATRSDKMSPLLGGKIRTIRITLEILGCLRPPQ